MRKITKEAVSKFLSKETFRKSNMSVEESSGVYKLKLHGNTIATIDELGVLSVSNAGWRSNTTKERLNGIPGVRVHQRNWNWYLNGVEWDGSWKRISIV
jgi:hypothetical protein